MDLADLTRDLEALRDDVLASIAATSDVAALEALELDVLGKKGRLTAILRGIGGLPADDRPRVGAVANVVRSAIEAALAERGTAAARLRADRAPGRRDGSTSRCPAGRSGAAACTRASRRCARSPTSSPSSGSSCTRAPRSRTTSPTSRCSTSRPTIPPGTCGTRCTSMSRDISCGRTPRRARSGSCSRWRHRSARCCPDAATATRRPTPRTARSSSRSRA